MIIKKHQPGEPCPTGCSSYGGPITYCGERCIDNLAPPALLIELEDFLCDWDGSYVALPADCPNYWTPCMELPNAPFSFTRDGVTYALTHWRFRLNFGLYNQLQQLFINVFGYESDDCGGTAVLIGTGVNGKPENTLIDCLNVDRASLTVGAPASCRVAFPSPTPHSRWYVSSLPS